MVVKLDLPCTPRLFSHASQIVEREILKAKKVVLKN